MFIDEFSKLAMGQTSAPIVVGRISQEAALAIGAKTRVVWLSYDTLKKQLIRHRDMKPEHYEMLPYVLKHGEILQLKRPNVLHIIMDMMNTIGHKIEVVIKSARLGEEVYLTSAHRIRSSDEKKIRRRATKIIRN